MTRGILMAFAITAFAISTASAQIALIAKGTLTGTSAGSNADLSGLTGLLENGAAANLLGGLGSGIAYLDGDTFLALPDRGPNAVSFDAAIDDTVSYVNRFHTVRMHLQPGNGGTLPFTIAPEVISTTLLRSITPLAYSPGEGLGVGSGVPEINKQPFHYFTGRSDNFNPDRTSDDGGDGRFDTEGIRASNDGKEVFISDEYGPYVYQFDRATGTRTRIFRLPAKFFVSNPSSQGAVEIANSISGRVANKGMEGLAITPDGKTLVGIMQNALIQDAAEGGDATRLLRIVTIDIKSGKATHEYGYLLTTGSGVSEILALNNHEMLVDERDGKGLGDGSKAKIKQIFKVELADATDIGDMNGTAAASNAAPKTLFLDVVQALTSAGFTTDQIPAKIEGIAFGPDVASANGTLHTLWVANDNDFLQDLNGPGTNPNQFFVFGFSDSDLGGSKFIPQEHSR